MKHTVPIYLADVTVKIVERTGRLSTTTKFVLLKQQIVKGFTLKDIAKRKQNIANHYCTDKKSASIVGLVLHSQHGYGINELV